MNDPEKYALLICCYAANTIVHTYQISLMFQQNAQFSRTLDGCNGLFAKRHHCRGEIYRRFTAIDGVVRATGPHIGDTRRRRLITTTC